MRRRDFFFVIISATALGPVASPAQQPKNPVVGVLVAGSPDPSLALERFRQGLHDLGYVEGQNLHIEIRSAEGHSERLTELAAELVREKVDIIAAWLTLAVLAASRATNEIPIVMIGAADPVGVGLVASLARPGGNVTGMAGQIAELAGKQVELLKEVLPQLERSVLCAMHSIRFQRYFLPISNAPLRLKR